MAAASGHQNITFPALGTGNLRYPVDEVAKAMIEATTEYVESNSATTLKEVSDFILSLNFEYSFYYRKDPTQLFRPEYNQTFETYV